MSTIFKAFIVVLSALFMVVSGFSVTAGFGGAVAANNYMESVSNLIIESYYNDEVIEACVQDAETHGYELTVSVEGKNKPGTARYMQIKLTYDFKLELFGYTQEKTLTKVL